MSTSKLALLPMATMAMGGYTTDATPFPGAVRRETPNFLEDCIKLYPTVRLIEQKKSRLSANERREVMAGFKWRWDRLDNDQKAKLQEFVRNYKE